MEVLVVVAILVILAGGAFVITLKYLDDAKIDRAKMDVKELEKTVMAYKLRHGDFPQSLEVLAQPDAAGGSAYIEQAGLFDPWQHEYVLEAGNLHPATQKPHIYSHGPRMNDPTSRISNW